MKKFREFIAVWIEMGFEWYKENPKWITKYRFGHDFNSDYCYRFLYKDGIRNPDESYKTAQNVLCELIPMLIVHKSQMDSSTAALLTWLRRKDLSEPSGIEDFFVKEFAYIIYQLLKEK